MSIDEFDAEPGIAHCGHNVEKTEGLAAHRCRVKIPDRGIDKAGVHLSVIVLFRISEAYRYEDEAGLSIRFLQMRDDQNRKQIKKIQSI